MNTVLKNLVDSALAKRVVENEDLRGYKSKKTQPAICDCGDDGDCCGD
ncbi:MAG: hypothetical protein WCW54_00795 [Candidatus Paceibacterota bacterium]|jgi:hypothetical protein